MESSQSKEMLELRRYVEILAAQRDEALAGLRQARSEIDKLQEKLAAAEGRLHTTMLDVEYLTLSRRLADTPEALAEARSSVRSLLARVEKAIELLKDDAGV